MKTANIEPTLESCCIVYTRSLHSRLWYHLYLWCISQAQNAYNLLFCFTFRSQHSVSPMNYHSVVFVFTSSHLSSIIMVFVSGGAYRS